MKPLDPRLMRYAAASRGYLVIAVLLGLAQVLLVLAFAWLLAAVITTAIAAVYGEPITDFSLPELPGVAVVSGVADIPFMLGALAGVVGLRAVVAWASEVVASRAATKVKSQLRRRTAGSLAQVTAAGGAEEIAPYLNSARAVNVIGSGLDALDNYFARYLPQLVLTALAIPVHLVVLGVYDMTTAVIVALTMPLIPVFMVLIGWTTQAAQQRQRARQSRLARAYLDIIEGLSTLKIFNRQRRQESNVERISEDYRSSMFKVLRVSFLSGFVLELAASLSVALVAVSIGVRLIDGSLGLFVGLFALLIVPEAFAPLRQVGANYHAAADGVAAAEDVFTILDAAQGSELASGGAASGGAGALTPASGATLVLHDFSTGHHGEPAVIKGLSAQFQAGSITAIIGPSGAGKSTLFAGMLGLLPRDGSLSFQQPDETVVPVHRDAIAWSGQRSGLRSGTVLDNVVLGDAQPDSQLARAALSELGLNHISRNLKLGVRGAGLSGGQAHRVAVARALYRARRQNLPILMLDEPTAALDAEAENQLIGVLRAEALAGRAVLVISHRPAVIAEADQSLHIATPELAPAEGADSAHGATPAAGSDSAHRATPAAERSQP